MKYVTWTLGLLVLIAVGAFLHWSLPSRDIVRILGTEVARSTVAETNDRGQEVTRTRDVRYIKAVTPTGRPRVYRNEDTGWSWPPYFKFDSANLAVRADNAVSTEAQPRWMIVTHYGWRGTMFSMFPNAVSIAPAEGPDQRLIPWFNIAAIVGLAVFLIVVVLLIRRQIARWFGG